MGDIAPPQNTTLKSTSISAYRVVKTIKNGSIISSTRICADNDKQAIELVMDMIDDHVSDLWDGFRLVAHIPPAD